jgi:hypothetical protein
LKWLKHKFAKTKSIISIKTYKRPLFYIILMMVFLNLLILSIAAIIAISIDDNYTNFIDAFANGSLKWMLTPNAILEIDNPNTLILAVLVLITGLVLFSGTIIALTTNQIKEFIQKKNAGSGKILLDYQIVVINWNSKVAELVSDLIYVESSEVTIVILANIDKTYAEKQIQSSIKNRTSNNDLLKINVLVKNGDPLSYQDLNDVSIENARAILIMNPDEHQLVSEDMSKSDLYVIKNILTLGPIHFKYDPPIVVEIKYIETKDKILTLSKAVKSLHEHNIMPICFDKRLGQIIAQTLIEPKIKDVYSSLFSFEGSEIYLLENTTIDQCLKEYSHAIPLASIDSKLFVLSPNNKIKHKKSIQEIKPISLKTKKINESHQIEIYIVGKNNKLSFILDSFTQYEKIHQSKFSANWIKDNELKDCIEKLNHSGNQATILLLSDEMAHDEAMDANIINQLIYIESNLKNKNIDIIVELLDPKNETIIKGFNINNTIISNKVISLLLSKLALFQETSIFYENLLSIAPNRSNEDNQSILIEKISNLIDVKEKIVFKSKKQAIESLYIAFNKKMMLFGFFRKDELFILDDDLNKEIDIELLEDDLLILMRL